MKTYDKTLLKIIQMLQDIVKRYASHMDDRDNIWHQTMKNDKYVLQMENKVWYLEWVNESLKKKIKPHQAAHLMMALKLFRSTRGYKADNYHDLSVYNDMAFALHKKDIDKKV